MDPNFEEMWNCSPPDNMNKDIFATTQPVSVPFEMQTESDVQMLEAYKKAHLWDVYEVTKEMEMIDTKIICRKCLLHRGLCNTYGHNLKKYEAEQHAKARAQAKAQAQAQTEAKEQAKAQEKAQNKAQTKAHAKAQSSKRYRKDI
ncbi:uncharacterized protein LOC6561554 [Drosophila grimshawi]|uniref:GH11162 n=1 Tax=Drosophila grimshawi TaxID=7222 RepID=B4JDC7_DROGR|nr:uncharacterized protein LOC6561554 [Drosophila grimshawi]EDW03300.1 GH11162 [Drosophila grimshawi]